MAGVRAARGAWRKYVEAARAFGASQPPGRYHEVRYEALVAEPEPRLRALFEFLGEAWDPVVLEYDKAEHDGVDRHASFTARRRSEGGETSTIYRSRVGAGRTSLDPVLRTMLHRSSGDLLRELGYLD